MRPAARVPPRRKRLTIHIHGARGRIAAELCRAARHTLIREGLSEGAVEIQVVTDAAMRVAHARWTGDRSSTDVLTFDLRERGTNVVDGTILVCRDVARRAARELRTTVLSELRLYVVHGCLHLAGYDDSRRTAFVEMHRREDQILGEMGCRPALVGRSRRW